MMMTSITNRAGIPMLLNFSMPPEMPPRLMRKQMSRNSSVNITQPKGLVSMEPNRSAPVLTSAPEKARLLRFRAMYSMQ